MGAVATTVKKDLCSAIYVGEVFHQRHYPKQHKFSYSMAMIYLDVDELSEVFASSRLCGSSWYHPLRFKRKDFHGDPAVSIKQAVYETVKRELNIELDGPVRVLSHWRVFGFNFNPLSTYYCFNKSADQLVAVVAEVTNTPWLERKAYVLAASNAGVDTIFDKGFTVSPFNPVDMTYHWQSSSPNSHLNISIDTYHNTTLRFHAVLSLRKIALTKSSVRCLIRKVSTSSYAVVFAIYWQALRLFIKGVPFLGKDKVEGIR